MSGHGKRFQDAGYTIPKPFIEVDGKPMIYHVLDLFPGEKKITCICNIDHLDEVPIIEVIKKYSESITIEFIHSHKLGPVYAVSQIFDSIQNDEEVIVSYCDYGTVWNYNEFLKFVRENKLDGAIPSYRGFHPHMLGTDNYAFVKLKENSDFLIQNIREKQPFTENRMEEYASNGTYYFRTGSILKTYFKYAIENDIQLNGEYYVSLVYKKMLEDSFSVGVFEIQKMLQWGTPSDLETYSMWSTHFKRQAMSKATLILPMAGHGSRFQMEGFSLPKPLLPVNNKPMICRAVESLPNTHKKVFICLNEHLEKYPLAHTLEKYFSNTNIISINKVTEGQACTCEIGLNIGNIEDDEPILISACDNGVDYNHSKYIEMENDPSIDVIVWSFTNNPTSKRYPHMYAWLDVDEKDNIKYVSVKKELKGASHCIIGTMYFRKASIYRKGLELIYENNIRTNGEFYVDDLLNPLIQAGFNVKVFPVDAYICWGTPADYKTYCYWHEHFSNVWGSPLLS
jgi:NDP-sugar pyrophosphorylase family protein